MPQGRKAILLKSHHLTSAGPLPADPMERQLATGDFGGRLQVWDLERPAAPVSSTPAHIGIINAIDGGGSKVQTCLLRACQFTRCRYR